MGRDNGQEEKEMIQYREIAKRCLQDEAQAVLKQIEYLDEEFDHVVDLILACHGKVIVTGVGKSGHIGAKIAATLSSTGTPSFFISPLDVFHGDLGAMTPDDVVLGISNSGQTDELLRFVPYLLERNIPLVGISSNPESLLAKYSTHHICVKVNMEACPLGLAPTSSTTATLAMGDALASALMEARHFGKRDFARFHPGGRLGHSLLLSARDVMRTNDLPIIPMDMKLGEALLRMSHGMLGLAVIVVDNQVEGLLTDGDVRRAMEKLQDKFFSVPVSEVMTKSPICVSPDMKVNQITELLGKKKIHAVIVVDENKHLLGIVDNFRCMI